MLDGARKAREFVAACQQAQQMHALAQQPMQAASAQCQQHALALGMNQWGSISLPSGPAAAPLANRSMESSNTFSTSQAIKLAAECDRLIGRIAFWRGFLGWFASLIIERLADSLNAKTDKIEHWIGAVA